MRADRDLPWWAIALLELPTDGELSRVRRLAQRGYLAKIHASSDLEHLWEQLVRQAGVVEAKRDIEAWIVYAPEACRFAALESPRAFCQFTNLLDDTLKVPFLADFHVRALRYMREMDESLILLPFGHGKSWLSSMLVPFMDWAENPEFTQGRIYFNKQFADNYTKKLMSQIERNVRMQAIFPWIRKPIKPNLKLGISGDPCWQIWSTRGFSIGGKEAVEPSFEPLTVKAGATGKRYWRTGCDDWVNSDNAPSETMQDKMWDYYHTGPKTMKRVVPEFKSHHGTRIGLFTVGTLFHRRDLNFRLRQEHIKEDKPVMRVDVYVDKEKTKVIWPDERPLEYIQELERSLGPVAFRMRCRNIIQESDEVAFPEQQVEAALQRGASFVFGTPPPGVPILIGFDPATGKRTRYAKFPAVMVLAFVGDVIHVVEWARWSYPQPKQIDLLAEMADKYNSPVAIEDASQQINYAYWMEERHPRVRVITHTTKDNKRDWAQGVESFIPLFENGAIVIHTGNAPGGMVSALREELISYPQGRYTDLVMAMWVAKYQFTLAQTRFQGRFVQEPVYRRGSSTFIDLRALRQRQYGEVREVS